MLWQQQWSPTNWHVRANSTDNHLCWVFGAFAQHSLGEVVENEACELRTIPLTMRLATEGSQIKRGSGTSSWKDSADAAANVGIPSEEHNLAVKRMFGTSLPQIWPMFAARPQTRLCLALATREDERIASQPRAPVSREAGGKRCKKMV